MNKIPFSISFVKISAENYVGSSRLTHSAWLTFFKIFSDNARNLDTVVTSIESVLRRYRDIGEGEKAALVESFERIAVILRGDE